MYEIRVNSATGDDQTDRRSTLVPPCVSVLAELQNSYTARMPLPKSANSEKLLVTMYSELCPAEPMETAEVFVMKRMDLREASVYQQHLTRCEACLKLVEMERALVQGMRDACRQLADDDEKNL